MGDYPKGIVPVNHVEPVPRRIRGSMNGETVFDSTDARKTLARGVDLAVPGSTRR